MISENYVCHFFLVLVKDIQIFCEIFLRKQTKFAYYYVLEAFKTFPWVNEILKGYKIS